MVFSVITTPLASNPGPKKGTLSGSSHNGSLDSIDWEIRLFIVIMGSKQLFLADITRWSSAIPEATPEPELLASLDEHLASLPLEGCTGDQRDLTEIAKAIALTENAERVQSKVNQAYIQVIREFSDSADFTQLSSADAELYKGIIESIAIKCMEEGERTASNYIPRESRTWPSLRLKKAKKAIERSLFETFATKEVGVACAVLGKVTQFFAEFQEFVGQYMQKLRDEGHTAPQMKAIWQDLKDKYAPAYCAIPGLPRSYVQQSENRFKAAFLLALLRDFGPYASSWIKQIHSGQLQLFDAGICRPIIRQLVLSAAFAIIPPKAAFLSLRNSLKDALNVEEMPGWKGQLGELQSDLPMQEKLFTLLSLTLFFVKIDSYYHSASRHFLRELTLQLFSSPDSLYPINEWLLVHICELHISLSLDDAGCSPLRLPTAADLERANEELRLEDPVTLLELQSLTKTDTAAPLHVTIVIPGWLSEPKDLQLYWKSVAQYSYYGEVLGLRWEAEDKCSVVKKEASRLADIFGEFWTPVGLITSIWHACSVVKDSTFTDSAKKADDTGRVLAHLLRTRALGNVTVSLIGFSLGGRMVASTLSELANEPEIYIQDAILIGAAVSHSEEKWPARRKAVAGRLVNVMSSNDEILTQLYAIATGETAAGIHPVEVEGVENFDATEYVSGHGQHPQKLDKTMTLLNFSP